MKQRGLLPLERIERKIVLLRGKKVMLDSDLAGLYGVAVKVLNQAVKRNRDRFPADFIFQLTRKEDAYLRSQIVTLDKSGRGRYKKYLPYAFSEQGVAMLSGVLQSKQAVQVNIQIMRVFVKLREMISTHKDLVRRLDELEKRYDGQFQRVFNAIRSLMAPQVMPKKRIGFM